MGFGACVVGPSGFLGLGSLYEHSAITLGKNFDSRVVPKVSPDCGSGVRK